jgi:hypothetical protein
MLITRSTSQADSAGSVSGHLSTKRQVSGHVTLRCLSRSVVLISTGAVSGPSVGSVAGG